ncbi:hypothetical protein SAMN04488550_4525 [Gordonia malaquae]|nr:hypothetical protein SAMN04488550_4525 [Gordonia malaquae]
MAHLIGGTDLYRVSAALTEPPNPTTPGDSPMRSVPVGVCASTLSLGHYLRPEGKAGQSRDMQGRRGKEGSLSAE